MNTHLKALKDLPDHHGEQALNLFNACNGELFPCDTLSLAVLERSLHLLKGFSLLLSHGGYTTGVGLLRMQMDNVLRLHGVIAAADPHGTANKIAQGVPLRTLKDRTGKKMTDRRLVELLSAENPWVDRVYNLACGYIHLSDQHIRHFFLRSEKDSNGLRNISIGDEEYVDLEQKDQLIDAFAVLTRGILEIVSQWAAVRHGYGINEQLKKQFADTV